MLWAGEQGPSERTERDAPSHRVAESSARVSRKMPSRLYAVWPSWAEMKRRAGMSCAAQGCLGLGDGHQASSPSPWQQQPPWGSASCDVVQQPPWLLAMLNCPAETQSGSGWSLALLPSSQWRAAGAGDLS